mgnify:CR=1 FL=1
MNKAEKISLGILLGIVFFGCMVLSYNLGSSDSQQRINQQGKVIQAMQGNMNRFRNLYLIKRKEAQRHEANFWNENRLCLELLQENVKLNKIINHEN